MLFLAFVITGNEWCLPTFTAPGASNDQNGWFHLSLMTGKRHGHYWWVCHSRQSGLHTGAHEHFADSSEHIGPPTSLCHLFPSTSLSHSFKRQERDPFLFQNSTFWLPLFFPSYSLLYPKYASAPRRQAVPLHGVCMGCVATLLLWTKKSEHTICKHDVCVRKKNHSVYPSIGFKGLSFRF